MSIGRYVIPIEILSKYRAETVDILRLGAIANALNAVTGTAATSLSRGVGQARDTLQSSLLMASYLKEAIEILDQRRLWELIDKAIAAGLPLPHPLDYYRQLFSRGKGSLYKRVLISWRNTKGFHVDPEHFEEWLNRVQEPEITIWQRDSDSPLDWAFTISMQIQSFYGHKVEATDDVARDLGNALHLVFIVEALCAGLLVEAGYNFRSGWRPARFMRTRIEYQFRDGRQPAGDERVVAVEGQVQLTGNAVHELREHFALVFGVLSDRSRVGYVLFPPDGGLMRFSAPCGSARVFAGPEVPPPAISLPDDISLFIRLRDAGSWGEQQTLAALRLAEAVRAGRATATDADALTAQFTESLDYWRSLQGIGDEMAARRRAPSAVRGHMPDPVS
jgi:hypothetical protein